MTVPTQADLLVKESDFQEWYRDLTIRTGWLNSHIWRSIHSPAGFPDNVSVRLEPVPRLVICELKTEDLKNSQPSIDQWMWLYILQHMPFVEAFLFRPSDRDLIEALLK